MGDIDPVATKALIAETFGRIPASLQQPSRAAAAGTLDSSLLAGGSGNNGGPQNGASAVVGMHQDAASVAAAAAASGSPAAGAVMDGLSSQSHHRLSRPPVEHQWGCGSPLHGAPPAPVSIFRHRLLQLFQLSVFCKLPIRPMTKMADIRCAGEA